MPPSFRAADVVIHPAVLPHYERLRHDAEANRKPGQAIWKSLTSAFARAHASAQFADPIPVDRIPPHFRRQYQVGNLYCVDLAAYWRAFYTIEARIVIFLDVVDHARYDEWFPNKGK